jgi:hypothetical protein
MTGEEYDIGGHSDISVSVVPIVRQYDLLRDSQVCRKSPISGRNSRGSLASTANSSSCSRTQRTVTGRVQLFCISSYRNFCIQQKPPRRQPAPTPKCGKACSACLTCGTASATTWYRSCARSRNFVKSPRASYSLARAPLICAMISAGSIIREAHQAIVWYLTWTL